MSSKSSAVDLIRDGTLGTQQRISFAGGIDDALKDAYDPVVNYGSSIFTSSESLVCWREDGDTSNHTDEEFEVVCRRLDGEAAGIESWVQISHQGIDGDPAFDASAPTIAFDALRNRYLVCWSGDEDVPILGNVDNAFEIFCGEWDRSLTETLPPRALSGVGPPNDDSYDAVGPTITWAVDSWGLCYGADEAPGTKEIQCRNLTQSLSPVGPGAIQVSTMGSDSADSQFDAFAPTMARAPDTQRWMVVWYGDDDDVLFEGEYEIWGQVLDPNFVPEIFADGFESGNTSAWSSTSN